MVKRVNCKRLWFTSSLCQAPSYCYLLPSSHDWGAVSLSKENINKSEMVHDKLLFDLLQTSIWEQALKRAKYMLQREQMRRPVA